jgi:poly(3-hydroxybutyrate) depolymerase
MGGSSTARASGGSAGSGFGGAGSGGTTSDGTGQGGRTTGTTSAGCGTTNPPKTGKYSITAASLDRTYVIDVPTNYDPNKPYTLLFAWHPNGGNAQSIADTDGGYYGIKPIANNTAIFVAGDGISAGWANTNDRDIAFVKAMLDRFFSQLCIDKSRIFSTGWSYGGMFSYALGCAMADVFRAIAPTSGALMSGCADGTHPVAMWGAHGLNDSLVNISSGREARDVFLTRNHCSKTAGAPDANKCVKYEGCDSGYPVVWCEWSGGHLYPPFGAAETWKFFSQF